MRHTSGSNIGSGSARGILVYVWTAASLSVRFCAAATLELCARSAVSRAEYSYVIPAEVPLASHAKLRFDDGPKAVTSSGNVVTRLLNYSSSSACSVNLYIRA